MSGFLNGGSATGAASGDLSGSFPAPTVTAVRGITVPVPSGSNTLLTYNAGAFTWSAAGAGGITTLTGDVTASGSGSVAATVVNINGASVPAAGSLTTGNILQVSGASALTYGALNLGGGSNYVTGSLPVANVAPGTSAQVLMSNGTPATTWTTLSGDVTVSATGVTTVNSISGSTPILITPVTVEWTKSTVSPVLSQAAQTTDTATNALTIQAQSALNTASTNITGGNLNLAAGIGATSGTNYTSGSINLQLGSPGGTGSEGYVTVQRSGTTIGNIGYANVNSGSFTIWAYGVSPSANNAAAYFGNSVTEFYASSTIQLNVGTSVQFAVGGGVDLTWTSSQLQWAKGVSGPTYTQAAQTTDTATNNLTFTSQGPYSGATTNLTPGNIVLNTPAPVSAGAPGLVKVQSGGTNYVQMGQQSNGSTIGSIWLGNVTPSTSNYTLYSDSATGTVLQSVAGQLTINGKTNVQLEANGVSTVGLNATTITFTTPQIAWVSSAASPNVIQTALSSTSTGSGSAGQTLAFTAQAGQAATGASNNGGNGGSISLSSGTGGTSGSATAGVPGNVILNTPAPSGALAPGLIQVQSGGTSYLQFGQYSNGSVNGAVWLGNVSAASTNYALLGNSSTTVLNFPSGGNLLIQDAGSTVLNISGLAASSFAWSNNITTSITLSQTALASTSAGSGAAGVLFNISAQAGQAATGASNNGGNGGNLLLSSGAGGTSGSATAGSAGSVNLQVGGTNALVVNSTTFTATPPTWSWTSTAGNTAIQQSNRGSDLAPSTMTVIAQGAFATATTNITGGSLNLSAGPGATSNATFTSGSVNLQVNAPNSGGTEAFVNVQRAGSTLVAMGALVGTTSQGTIYLAGVTPSATNFALSGSTANTYLNAPSGGTVYVDVGNSIVAQFNSTSLNVQTGLLTFYKGLAAQIQVSPQTGDFAPETLTVQAANAYASATSNTTGANLNLLAGAGATSNATYTSGNINLQVNAPNSGGTEAYVNVQRAGSTLLQLGALVGTTTSGAIYGPGVTPSATNYSFSVTNGGTNVAINGSQVAFYASNNVQFLTTSTGVSFQGAVGGYSGNSAFHWNATSIALSAVTR